MGNIYRLRVAEEPGWHSPSASIAAVHSRGKVGCGGAGGTKVGRGGGGAAAAAGAVAGAAAA
ncbi:MAG: hypothetical protein KJ023_21545, partial [Burkholderiaceae bacterium]|nr:hypothetical protein [Burkholderiaceae bacterium]